MKCIYDRNMFCEINPDGPMTKSFVCLKCHKPEKKSKNESIGKQKRTKQGFFNARGKIRRLPLKKKGLGRGRGRGRR